MGGTGPINIDFKGDVAACHDAARWLSEVAAAVHHAGTQLHQCRSESEAAWRGSAADNFRSSVGNTTNAADDLEERATKVGKALGTFAGDIDTIQRQVVHVRGHARETGLTVAGTLIMPPGPKPGGAPVQPPAGSSPGATQQYEQQQAAFATAYADHQRKVDAFNEASTTIAQLREREEEAHRALGDVLRQKGFWDKYGFTLGGKYATAAGASQTIVASARNTLEQQIAGYDTRLATAQKLIDTSASTDPAAIAARRTVSSTQATRDGADEALTKLKKAQAVTKWTGGTIANANPGRFVRGSSSPIAKSVQPLAKKVPFAGTALTAASAGKAIYEGKPAAKEVEKAAGGTAASIAAGAAVGTMVGGPVGTVLGVGAGLVASYGVGWAVDYKNGPIEQANRALGLE